MIFSVLLSLFGLACLIGLVFRLAVFAFPAFMGLSVGMLLYDQGAAPLPSIMLGLLVGILTLILGQWAFAKVRSVSLRLLIACLFSIPAGFAGYSIIMSLSGLGGAPDSWTQILGIISGVIVAGTAYIRLDLRPESGEL